MNETTEQQEARWERERREMERGEGGKVEESAAEELLAWEGPRPETAAATAPAGNGSGRTAWEMAEELARQMGGVGATLTELSQHSPYAVTIRFTR